MLTETTRTDAVPETTAVDALEAPERSPRRRGCAATRKRSRVLTYVGLVVASCVAVFPLLFMVFSSFKDDQQIFADLGSLKAFLPTGHLSLNNYSGVFERVPAARFITNSLVVTVAIVVLGLIGNSMIGFAVSRLRWKGRDTVFAVFLGALMVPSIFTLLPNFVLVKQLHLIDTFLGVALPTMFMTPFAVFFLKQFFMNIPRELEEAALLDGASKVRVFFTLILPMAKAPISTLAILTYITAWNDYFWPLLVSYTDSSRVLTVALAVFRSQAPQTGPDWAGLMAATLVAALPMLLLFMAFARRIVNSIGFTGIK